MVSETCFGDNEIENGERFILAALSFPARPGSSLLASDRVITTCVARGLVENSPNFSVFDLIRAPVRAPRRRRIHGRGPGKLECRPRTQTRVERSTSEAQRLPNSIAGRMEQLGLRGWVALQVSTFLSDWISMLQSCAAGSFSTSEDGLGHSQLPAGLFGFLLMMARR